MKEFSKLGEDENRRKLEELLSQQNSLKQEKNTLIEITRKLKYENKLLGDDLSKLQYVLNTKDADLCE